MCVCGSYGSFKTTACNGEMFCFVKHFISLKILVERTWILDCHPDTVAGLKPSHELHTHRPASQWCTQVKKKGKKKEKKTSVYTSLKIARKWANPFKKKYYTKRHAKNRKQKRPTSAPVQTHTQPGLGSASNQMKRGQNKANWSSTGLRCPHQITDVAFRYGKTTASVYSLCLSPSLSLPLFLPLSFPAVAFSMHSLRACVETGY